MSVHLERKISIYEAALKEICEDMQRLEFLNLIGKEQREGYKKALLAEQALSLAASAENDAENAALVKITKKLEALNKDLEAANEELKKVGSKLNGDIFKGKNYGS